jgi:hypothetical protein
MFATREIGAADDRLQTMSGDEIDQVHELGTAAEQHALQLNQAK